MDKLLFEGKIVHGGNPLLRWMSGNVVVETDAAENIVPFRNCGSVQGFEVDI